MKDANTQIVGAERLVDQIAGVCERRQHRLGQRHREQPRGAILPRQARPCGA